MAHGCKKKPLHRRQGQKIAFFTYKHIAICHGGAIAEHRSLLHRPTSEHIAFLMRCLVTVFIFNGYRYHFELIDTFKADDKLILFVLTENFMYILLDIALEMR